MTRLPPAADGALPAAVRAALTRACALVEANGSGWTVGEMHAGPGADSLADALYVGWYTRATASSRSRDDPPLRRGSLLSALRAGHAGAATISPGWTAQTGSPRGVIAAVKREETRALRPGEYRMPLRPGAPPVPGEPVEPLARLDHYDSERGLWWAFGGPTELEPPIGRVYLNARPATAPRVVHELTSALAKLPHRLKCPVQAEACERVDAIVVYHERAARAEVLAALAARPQIDALLDPEVPPLTCSVGPGLAWADDVDPDRSFGETRCEAVAAAVEGASEDWRNGEPEGRLKLLIEGLRDAGIDPAHPWEAAP